MESWGVATIIYSNDKLGMKGEMAVYHILRQQGFKVKKMPHFKSGYDLLLNGKIRVEVKTSMGRSKSLSWGINFHRHGKTDESRVDLYIVRLHGVPGCKHALHMLMRAPINRPTIVFSVKSILSRYAANVTAWIDFVGSRGRKMPGRQRFDHGKRIYD